MENRKSGRGARNFCPFLNFRHVEAGTCFVRKKSLFLPVNLR
jgi:hypothetical protein